MHHVLPGGKLPGPEHHEDGGGGHINRCKGCELCVVVCNAAKHQAIEMQAVSATEADVA